MEEMKVPEIVRDATEQEAFAFLCDLWKSIKASRETPIVLDIYGDAVDMIIARDKEIQLAAKTFHEKQTEQMKDALQLSRTVFRDALSDVRIIMGEESILWMRIDNALKTIEKVLKRGEQII